MTEHDRRRRKARREAEKRSCVGTREDKRKVAALREECKRRRRNGEDVRVSHIVPLRHPKVCGLTNSHNLVILSAKEDDAMGNHFEPTKLV